MCPLFSCSTHICCILSARDFFFVFVGRYRESGTLGLCASPFVLSYRFCDPRLCVYVVLLDIKYDFGVDWGAGVDFCLGFLCVLLCDVIF